MRLLAVIVTAGGGRRPPDGRRLPGGKQRRAQAEPCAGYGHGDREPQCLAVTGRWHEAAGRGLVTGFQYLPP
jgi:hypothetical protein